MRELQRARVETNMRKCEDCGRFVRLEDATVFVPYGGALDMEPPEPVTLCGDHTVDPRIVWRFDARSWAQRQRMIPVAHRGSADLHLPESKPPV